jgi:hypothetical protein
MRGNGELFERKIGAAGIAARVYKMKKPYNDGTEYLLFSHEELLEKLAALVPIGTQRGEMLVQEIFDLLRVKDYPAA